MNQPVKQYRVSCRCSAQVAVAPGQAGGRVACPDCGASIDVPRLRDLEVAASPAVVESPPQWRACQAWFVAAVAIAIVASASASILQVRSFGGPPRLPGPDVIRAVVGSGDAATTYRAWQAMRGSGVDRGPLPEEIRIQKAAGMAGRIAVALWVVVAAAGATAVAAGIGCLARSRAGPAGPAGGAAS